MSISVIGGTSSIDATSGVQSFATKRQSSVPPATNAAVSLSISTQGDLLGKLQQLSQQDPAKFKDVVTKLASDLKTAAGSATGGQAQFLNKLSDQFSQAASSGNLSALQPTQAPQGAAAGASATGHHHHGHHHHGSGGGSSAVQSAFADALTQVDQALGATSSSAAAPATPAGATGA